MKINLWILIDNGGRILYTGAYKRLVENAKEQYPDVKDLHVVELKGEINV